jgi:hypothetical protein
VKNNSVLCAIYTEGEAFGEYPVSPVRVVGGDLRNETLALCKDELQGVLRHFTGAADRYAEYQRQAMRALWEAAMSEDWLGPAIWLGPHRRRLKSRLLYKGCPTPVNEIAPDAFQNTAEHEHVHQEIVFTTRRLDRAGRIETRNETEKDLLARWVIPPNHRHKIKWDFFLGFIILYSVMAISYRIGFNITPGIVAIVFDVMIDLLFLTDMIFNFRCGFVDAEGRINTILADIRKNYLQGFFVTDFLSTFPIDWVLNAIIGDESNSSRAVKMIRFARLFRLLKLVRVFKIARLITLANSFVEISPIVIKMSSLMMKIFFLTHLIGCFWYYVTTIETSGNACVSGRIGCEYEDPATTWYKELGPGSDTDSDFSRYVVAVYWVFTTMTTVGYGDITPTNDLERFYTVAVMIVGATVFGYIIGSIAELSSGREDAISAKLCVLRDYCDERGLNHRTQSFSVRHYAFWYQEMTPLHDEPKILHELSPALRKEVLLYIHRHVIRSIALFNRPLPDWFVATTVRLLEPQAFNPGCDIIGQNEAGMYQDIIFVQEGVCEAYCPSMDGSDDRFSSSMQPWNKRKKHRVGAEESEDNHEKEDVNLGEAEVLEVIHPGMVWGFDPVLARLQDDQSSSRVVCLRAGPEEPCFVFTLRYGALSDIYLVQRDYGCMLQEVLAETIMQQAPRKRTPAGERLGMNAPGSRQTPTSVSHKPSASMVRSVQPARTAADELPEHSLAVPQSADSLPSSVPSATRRDINADELAISGTAESSALSGLRTAAATCPDDPSRQDTPPTGGTQGLSAPLRRSGTGGSGKSLLLSDISPGDAVPLPDPLPPPHSEAMTSFGAAAACSDGSTGAPGTPRKGSKGRMLTGSDSEVLRPQTQDPSHDSCLGPESLPGAPTEELVPTPTPTSRQAPDRDQQLLQ